MPKNDAILKIISNETKSSIDQMPIVTPGVYASIFLKFASEREVSLDDEPEFSNDLMKVECSNLSLMQESASTNANRLSESAERAISAIRTKNEAGLAEVLKETRALKYEIEKLKESIYKDELTHAYNRKWLRDNYLTQDEGTLNVDGVLLMIDLNFFKQINDLHGHVVGDKVLIYVANQLKQTKSKVLRYGGDEFIVIFKENASLKHALDSIDAIREDVIGKKMKSGTALFTVSFSYGAVAFKKGDELSNVVELADKNMYDDKIQIKKRVTGI